VATDSDLCDRDYMYPGGKSGSGVYQALINRIPQHHTFISAFAGHCGVLRRIKPAERSIAIDPDPAPLEWMLSAEMDGDKAVEMVNAHSIPWMRHHFGLDRLPRGTASSDPMSGDGGTFVLADPPYPASVRKGGSRPIYRHEQLTDDDHDAILETLTELPCCVMICGIRCKQYDRWLSGPNWRRLNYWVTYRSGDRIQETAWMNYSHRLPLHDWRYFGADRRKREVFKKRRRNLMRRLEAMPVAERESLLCEIRDRWPSN